MTDKDGKSKDVPTVGSRVRNHGARFRYRCQRNLRGVVIEDFADMVLDRGSVGLDWAPVHRSAIALDDGRLIFANDEDLTPATRVIRGVPTRQAICPAESARIYFKCR